MNFPNYYQPIQQPKQEDRIWVQNQQEAEHYLIAPNSFVRLWDINQPRFYERKCDISGKPYPIEVYEYNLINGTKEEKPDYDNLISQITSEIQSLKERISNIEKPKKEK